MLKSTLLAAIFREPNVPFVQAEAGCWALCFGLYLELYENGVNKVNTAKVHS